MRKQLAFWGMITFLALSIVGCGMMQNKTQEGTDVDYTVVKKADYPQEITEFIELKRQEKFQVSFQCQDSLYLVRGYGIQSTGGHSIQVEYIRENADELHIKTKLIGPDASEQHLDVMSCPIIVVKMESRDKKIIFD